MAANVNQVVLTGNLTRDPEVKEVNGTPLCSLRIAVNTNRKTAQGDWEDKANYFDVSVWGGQANACAQYLAKGRPVAIVGRLDWSEWETDAGEKRQAVKVMASQVQFLGGRDDQPASGDVAIDTSGLDQRQPVSTTDDIPF
jgi:single-strand DNA-binding protein